MPGDAGRPSPALLAANQRLYKLRKAKRLAKQVNTPIRPPDSDSTKLAGPPDPGASNCGQRNLPDLPPHLGWHSPAVTNALRKAIARQRPAVQRKRPLPAPTPPALPPDERESQTSATSTTVRLYPDLALGMLQEGQAAAGRIWLLLRHLDVQGQGWLLGEQAKNILTRKNSELRVCGQRQLRNLLRQGEGIFWQREKERIWLQSAAKVALALGVRRLSGRPVALPLTILLSGIGKVRAHFYASFHSGRLDDEDKVSGSPISRGTLSKLTGVPERSQRHYEQTAGVRTRKNIAVGESWNPETFQERAWRHGRGAFKFQDHRAKFGPAGQSYVAWRLPNSYGSCHQQCANGRQKKINQQIDLVDKWAQGNDLPGTSILFHHSAAAAAKSYNRCCRTDVYWPDKTSRNCSEKIWYVLPAQGG